MKRIPTIVATFVVVAGLMSFAPAHAGFYFGASVGQASADVGLGDLGTGLSGSLDDTDTNWKIYGGFKVIKFFAVEATWTDLSEISAAGTDGSGSSFSASMESTGYSVAALGVLPVGTKFNVFAKMGYMFWDADSVLSTAGIPLSGSTDGEDELLGAGLVWDYKGPGSLRVEYETSKMDDLDVNSLSAGVAFKF